LIDDPTVWFGFIEDRNETVHTYDKKKANVIFSDLHSFDSEVEKLISKLKSLKLESM
jgi:hypothetical protein